MTENVALAGYSLVFLDRLDMSDDRLRTVGIIKEDETRAQAKARLEGLAGRGAGFTFRSAAKPEAVADPQGAVVSSDTEAGVAGPSSDRAHTL